MDTTRWEVPSGSGVTLAQSLKGWLDGGGGGQAALHCHVDRVAWPDNRGCAALGVADN